MNIEILSEKDNKIEFLLKGSTLSFANLIRRFGMSRVPVFAIDKVTFYENDSAMFDEYIAHRLGLVPIASERNAREGEEVLFTLEASGPATIYSKDLKSTDPKIKAAFENIPLLKLLEGQNLRLEAKARLGVGSKHAKWQAGLISYEVLGEKEFKMKLESFMQLEPRELLLATADMIIKRCDEIEENLSKAEKKESG